MQQARIKYTLKRAPDSIRVKLLRCEFQHELEQWVKHWLHARQHMLDWNNVTYETLSHDLIADRRIRPRGEQALPIEEAA